MSDAWTNDPPATTQSVAKQPWELDAPAQGPSTQQRAVVSANDNADEAAKALAIGRKTGIAPTVVQSDVPGYDAHMRTQSAIKAVANPAIAKYIDGNPMAAKVSGDDYDHLDEVSQTMHALGLDRVNGRAQAGVFQAVPEIAEMFGSAPGREKLFGALKQLPGALAHGILDFFQTPGKVASGEINLNTPEGLDAGISFGLGVALGGGRVSAGPAAGLEGIPGKPGARLAGNEQALRREMGAPQSFDDFMATLRGMETRQEIDDFIASKTPGPPGALLQITKAEAASEALTKAVETAQESKTKQRSPELFTEFGAAHDTGNVHISGSAIYDLYIKAGKVPAEGDGLFGFIPDAADKISTAFVTGGEITIPTSQYIAHVDPTVHEGLKNNVRLHDDGVTLEEAKEAQSAIEAWHGTPHDFERFDLSKIGTGEGAQVYGHGLYFAENKAVGQEYQKNLGLSPEKTAKQALVASSGDVAKAIDVLLDTVIEADTKKSSFGETREMINDAIELLRSGKEIVVPNSGQLYKVKINADPTKFLDWDLPLQGQDHVQAALEKLGYNIEDIVNKTGGEIYDTIASGNLTKRTGRVSMKTAHEAVDREAASRALAEAGIPGIKYLDQGSRVIRSLAELKEHLAAEEAGLKTFESPQQRNNWSSGSEAYENLLNTYRTSIADLKQQIADWRPGTRNFVVFDDKLVTITEKNGNPIVAAVEAAVEQEKASLYLNHLFQDAKSVGLTEPEFKRYSDKIAKAEAYTLERAVRLNRAKIAQTVSAEWKRNEAAMRDAVTEELSTTGRYAVAKFQRDNNITIDPSNADGLAPLFGYETGQELLAGVDAINIRQASTKKGWQAQLSEDIKTETARRMEEEHGRLAENISKEAIEIALADHTFDILADEVNILARNAGATPAFTREEMVVWARGSFERSGIAEAANLTKLERAVAKGGREAEKALLKGDFVEAFQAKQRQFMAAVLAKESLRLQSLINSVEAKIDRFTSEPTIKSIDQGFLEQIREMLASVGVPQVHAPGAPPMALRDFVTASEGQLAVAPWLFEKPKTIQEMSVAEFREFSDSLKSMEHVGRWATKLENARGEADLQNVVFDAIKELERFPFKDQPTNNPSLMQRIQGIGRKIVGMHLLVERALDYTDKFNPHGPLTEWLDRPLRDANVKEIELTEQVVRDLKGLKPHAGPEILEQIPNQLIPDALDATGFMKMTRQNLRVLMLNMGNWSNMRKLTEGFEINEADLRRFVDQHATKSDVAWVNGVWNIFKKLKPEADAVQLKDTGVPVDTIDPVPWKIKAGELDGGYYPLSYDPYNSDIQGHIARPLFDKGYFSAATPQSYTKERTGYAGAIDLSGDFLASKLRGMVHDIAFRLPVRNANKLIENQEFRTAMAQYWGKEVSDLLPGWLRDIANSHNFDDAYAAGFTRFSSILRQNVVGALIAYNPGTFIKHGFTAAVMSGDRVGFGPLLKAAGDLGWTGALKNMKELAWKSDRIPDEDFMQAFRDMLDQGERGENARQFVLDSSAVMRNRQRQYDESIRGAADQITNAGLGQSLANFRQRQILYGRMAVAFSDQMSAMPTWLAAYKKAYGAGESHADAVFIADKEVSRAHGSSFIGDKPLVSRSANTPSGEFARWFTTLYNFWNHQQNNQFQLAWDVAATMRGNPSGEPGANAARIAKAVGLIMGIIFIEEMAGPAKDEHGHGLLAQLALATARFFGGGYIGLREVTNGLAHGYEPSTGMIGTLFKGGTEVAKDLAKASGQKAGQVKDGIRNALTAIGFMTGVGGAQPGRTGQFIYDVARGKDRPQTFNDYRQGLRTGHSKARKFK